MSQDEPRGILRPGWEAAVGDYPIACGWALGGKVLAVADAVGGVNAFEATSGRALWIGAHAESVMALAVSPDGRTIATAGQDGHVLLWSAADGEVTQTLSLGRGWVEHVVWSPDGRWLAASLSRHVHVFDAEGQQVWRSEAHPSTVSALAWSGGQELATACYGQVAFFDVSSGETNQKLEWKGSLVSMALSPDGDIVACGSQDNTVHFWRRSSGLDSMMSGYPGKPSVLAFDHTGLLLATGGSAAPMVWSFEGDGPEGTQPGVLDFHVQPITALSFAPRRRRLASGGRDGGVVVWGVAGSGEGKPTGACLVGSPIAGVAWRPDGRGLAALDASGGVTVWRTST